MSDLTRWNRAGLARFEYLDGNAAVYLERLRAGLAREFPHWTPARAVVPVDETEEARKQRLEELYAANPDDMLWQLTRQFARSCHVLGVHLDAYANESYLETASQWDNLRKLVALLDYAPRPPASASAPVALILKPGKSGVITAGLQIKHSPATGAPLMFETLTDLEADAAWNVVHARDYLRNPAELSGVSVVLEGRLDKLKNGEPLVLEDERDGRLSAHLLEGIVLGEASTAVTVTPEFPAGFARGWTRVHLLPKEKLTPIGPATTGVDTVGHSLHLAVPTDGLAAGDIVVIRSEDDKPYFRRIKAVHDRRLVFFRAIDQLTLAGATVARPVSVPLSDLANPPTGRTLDEDGTVFDVVFAAGDWSRLAGQWLADIRIFGEGAERREYLPAYRCLHAKYVPVTTDSEKVMPGDRPGYTALTLTWHPDTDGVPGTTDLKLKNPQALLAPPPTAGSWRVDLFLNRSDKEGFGEVLITSQCKHTTAGDLAVVVKGSQMAWARLGTVETDQELEESTLTAETRWRDRGGGPFFLSATRVHGHFTLESRTLDWTTNATTLTGRRIVPETTVAGWKTGRALIVDNGASVLETSLAAIDPAGAWFELADEVPAGTTVGNLQVYANVVEAGHGETRPERVLGSGDGTRSNQQFTLEVSDLSFVADPTMTAGVRADLDVIVAGETWTQVANLKDSESSDAHYQVRVDEDGHATIQFGDGRHGRRLPSGGSNVRVAFRQGSGSVGNLDPGSLVKLSRPHALIESLVQAIPSSGGADRETNSDLRENAPATLLALDRAVSLEDYTQLARGHASVWQARAFRRQPGLGQRERLEVVVMAAGGGVLSESLKAELRDFLAARGQPGVVITVGDFERVTFRLSVTIRVRTEAFDRLEVIDAVRTALESGFTEKVRQLGQPLYRGEIYEVVDRVTGVENSDCTIALVPPAAGVSPVRAALIDGSVLVARPGDRQCLVLATGGAAIVVEEYTL